LLFRPLLQFFSSPSGNARLSGGASHPSGPLAPALAQNRGTASAGTMPAHKRLGPDDQNSIEDFRRSATRRGRRTYLKAPTRRSSTRPRPVSAAGRTNGARHLASVYSAVAPCKATVRNPSPSRRKMMPNSAPHRCLALASKDSNTGARSPGELEMTCSTSAVAFSRSSASSRSRVS
jgi:hypothetical protein